jgi:carbamoyl-phosphate synthase small subunit
VTAKPMIAKLALEDGTVFTGRAFGATGTCTGEVVFNTSMMGYQEILTDPSYRGQIVTMTYPLIGNYGVNAEDAESNRVQASGFIVRELAAGHSNFRASQSLESYLAAENVIGISGIDTRALTRKIRITGAMNGVLSTEIDDDVKLVAMAKEAAGLVGRDLVREVSAKESCQWTQGYTSAFAGPNEQRAKKETMKPSVVAFDCGLKQNISRNLIEAGFDVTIVPATASLDEVLAAKPDGIFVSNGPGDPEPIDYTIKTIGELLKKEIPMFGICLGIELIGLAMGAKIYKMKFGHRGGNQPVMNLDTRKVEITAQNHGFALDADSLDTDILRLTHVNLNDQSLEGFAHKKQPMFAVQYHPEASPGPHDSTYLFDAFYQMVVSGKVPDIIT